MSLAIFLVGLALCLCLSVYSLKKACVKPAGILCFVPLSVLLCTFFAHLFYCLMRFRYAWFDMMPEAPGLAFLRFWDGNYMLYGGAVGLLLAVWLSVKIGKGQFLPAMDELSPWCALMIAFVRLYQGMNGKFYSMELQGLEDDWGETLPTGYEGFPWSIYDDYYEVWHWALYLVAIAVALLLCIILMRNSNHAPGDRFLLLTGLYAASTIILEGLRRDDVLRWGFVRCSQLISAVLVPIVAVCYCVRAGKGHTGRKIASFIMIVVGIGICMLMEFAQEQRINALLFLNRGACYLVSALSCCMIIGAILLMRSCEKKRLADSESTNKI